MPLDLYAILPFVVTVVSLSFAVYTITKGFRSIEARVFSLLALSYGLWFGMDLVTRFSGSDWIIPLLRVEWVMRTMFVAFFLNLALVHPKKRKIMKSKWGYFLLYLPAAVVSILMFFSVEGVQTFGWGYEPISSSFGSVPLVLYSVVYLPIAFFSFLQGYFVTKSKFLRKRVALLVIGSAFGVWQNVVGLPAYFFFGSELMVLNPLMVLIGGTLFAYSILMYKLFIIPVTEIGKVIPPKYHLEPGGNYLVKEKQSRISFKVFVNAVRGGQQGLCITTQHPNKIRKKHGLQVTPILWLSRRKLDYSVDPTSLGALYLAISEFTENSKEGVIFLDGVEYLISRNGFDRVLMFLHDVREAVALSRSKFIFSASQKILDKKDMALLERYTEEIKRQSEPQ